MPIVNRLDTADPAFPHGEERGYFQGCRQECCGRAHAREDKRRELAIHLDGDHHVRLARAQTHLLMLLDHGNIDAIRRAIPAKIDRKPLLAIAAGTAQYASRETYSRILATTCEQVAARPAWGNLHLARQQVHSLMRLGYTGKWIGRQCGVSISEMLYRHERIKRETCDRIAALYVKIGDRPGPSWRTTAWAKAKGHEVPGAYDERGNLIPGAARTVEYEERMATTASLRPDKVDDVADARLVQSVVLAGYTESARALAERLGTTERRVQRIRLRAGLRAPRAA